MNGQKYSKHEIAQKDKGDFTPLYLDGTTSSLFRRKRDNLHVLSF